VQGARQKQAAAGGTLAATGLEQQDGGFGNHSAAAFYHAKMNRGGIPFFANRIRKIGPPAEACGEID